MSRERGASVAGMPGVSKDGWVAVQMKAFTRWCNTHLVKSGRKIESLSTGLRDGTNLIVLIESLTDKSVGRWEKKPRMEIHSLENLSTALKFLLQTEKMRLVNIGPEDVVRGNVTITLGLVWALILKYQISGGLDGADQLDRLIAFINAQTASYGVTPITNVTSCLQDGRTMQALADSLEPGLVDMKATDPVARCHTAINVAHDSHNIPIIMDPADLVHSPDKLSAMTYLSYYMERYNQYQKTRANAGQSYATGPFWETSTGDVQDGFVIHAKLASGEPALKGGEEAKIRVTLTELGGTAADAKKATAAEAAEADAKRAVDPAAEAAADASSGETKADGGETKESKGSDGGAVVSRPGTVVDAEVSDNKDGTYQVKFALPRAGVYRVDVKVYGRDMKDAPKVVEVADNRKVALITGATRGLGLAIACALAQLPKTYAVLTGVDEKEGEEAVAALKADGITRVDFHQCDVNDDASVKRCLADVEKKTGRVDILVNYAGTKALGHAKQAALAADVEQVARDIAINATAPLKIINGILPGMIERRHGRIINTSVSEETLAASAIGAGDGLGLRMSKAALNSLTRTLAAVPETVAADVLINAFCPGYLLPSDAAASREEAVATVVMLATLPVGGARGHLYLKSKQVAWTL